MKKLILILVAAFLPSLTPATCTWTATTTTLTATTVPFGYAGGRSVKGVCTTGTETIASALANATDGLSITDLTSFSVTIESVAGQTQTGGKLAAFYYDDVAGAWSPVTDGSLDFSLSASAQLRQSALSYRVSGHRRGPRIALIPSGVTISSGNITIYLNGSP